jgi:Holliday junction resolvase RusA-like endonuclease
VTQIRFIIPGEPRGKGRPRASSRGGFTRLYTDAKTASYENLCALACKEAMKGQDPIAGPVSVSVTLSFPVPKSASKKKAADMLAGKIRHTKKPDADNCLKAILDGINGIAFVDDAQVVEICVFKNYGAKTFARVTVRELDQE